MPTTLWLLLSLAVPVLGIFIPVSCPQGQKCQLALLSDHHVFLECPFSKAHWYCHFSLSKEGWLINSSEHSNLKITREKNLAIIHPLPSQTGLYHCWEENSTQMMTQFEIDFQDAHLLHVTHKGLKELPLQNESLHVGSKELIFTRWEPWQNCDRCGVPGERKRLGYCYIEVPQEKPVPCGLYLKEKVAHTRLKPEMQVEACFVPCDASKETDQPQFIYESSQLTELTNGWLNCPLASIYR